MPTDHAHPAEQKVLGVLDTNLSLAKADAQLAQTTRRMLIYTLIALMRYLPAELAVCVAVGGASHQAPQKMAPKNWPTGISAISLKWTQRTRLENWQRRSTG